MDIKIINNIPGIQATMNESADGNIEISITKKPGRKLSEFKPGETVTIGQREYIVLSQGKDTTAVIAKKFAKEMVFGSNGDWRESDVRKYCNGEFYNELAAAIGAENIIEHTVNLMGDDGTGKGIACKDKVSILTTELYRRYREYLPAYGDWWWTATRLTWEEPDYARGVRYVNSCGFLSWFGCSYDYGVRPFCVLNSSISIS